MDEKEMLVTALRDYVEEAINHADLESLAIFSDQVWIAGELITGIDMDKRQALIRAGSRALSFVMGAEIKKPSAEPQPPFRVMTPIEQQDFFAIVESIQKKPGESDEAWRARYRRFEQTGETDLPDDVRARLRQDGESVESYLDRLKPREDGE